ncbi:MAG: HAD family hydrolase [Verrucomicrobia bacterium]|nr:HAD family hydrolase [Verrucomicrobiota bacterium]
MPCSPPLVLGFDADDTLWHNENIFEKTHERYRALLAQYHDAATVDRTLLATELRNLELYGYGVKGFTLSSIETAIQLTAGRIRAEEIQQIIELGREMLAHPVELLDGVAATLEALAVRHRLLLVTKGDLRDQERKLAKSRLASLFSAVEIVSEKNTDTYAAIFRRHHLEAGRFLMVGNSLKSDILPVVALGGYGAHVPYELTWAAERVDATPEAEHRLYRLRSLRELPEVVGRIEAQWGSGSASAPTA